MSIGGVCVPKIFSLLLCLILILFIETEISYFIFKCEGSYIPESNITLDLSKEDPLNETFSSILQTDTAINCQYSIVNGCLSDDISKMITTSIIKNKDKEYDVDDIELNGMAKAKISTNAEIGLEQVKKIPQELPTENPVITTSENENLKQDDLSTEDDTFINWWENDTIVANGYGIKPQNAENPIQSKILARRAAIADGYRRLAEVTGNVQITANETVVNTEIKSIIVGAKIVSEEFDDSGNCTVTLQIPIYGITDSFASAVLKPIEKENFPYPSEIIETVGTYTGVVIDCGDLELNPVLTPSIQKTDDEYIYSYSNLDTNQVIATGMIGYKAKEEIKSSDNYLLLGATSDRDGVDRVGDNPLVVKAVALNNDSSCPIINASDANKILSENQVSHFLDRGAVVFTSNRIRGMRM